MSIMSRNNYFQVSIQDSHEQHLPCLRGNYTPIYIIINAFLLRCGNLHNNIDQIHPTI